MKQLNTWQGWNFNNRWNRFHWRTPRMHNIFNGFFNASYGLFEGDKTIGVGEQNTKYRENNNEPYRFKKERQ